VQPDATGPKATIPNHDRNYHDFAPERGSGIRLVYVASQPANDPGVLILSCFAGAARELGGAVIVNPFDIEGMAEAILLGLNMPLGERKERWAAMMKVLERNGITAWRERFVRALWETDMRC
jgi:trehalose-6-phosphate synthase